ncbi:cinnamoyl-Coa reductase [Salvia divinorum]|uniref:Cinnamoyl-Coa reductase n=1 Tax=Salvia divinorum TaxID=28513 RepID=A0ABD1HW12_SALDI
MVRTNQVEKLLPRQHCTDRVHRHVHIVTGAQLGVWDFGAKSVLHLKLLFSKVPGCTIRRSVWDHSPSNLSGAQNPDGSSSSLSSEKEDGSSQAGKLAKIVDMTEMSKGPHDMPGHWLVTGAKLGVDKGRILLRVKYSLLNY